MRSDLGNVWLTTFVLGISFLAACSPAASSVKQGNATPLVASENIDLELKDAEVTDALRALSGSAHINIFADPAVNSAGPIDIHVHSQPWEQVLTQMAFDHKLRVENLDVLGAENASLWISKLSSPPAPVTSFRGDRIIARFDETQIRDAAKTLADVAKTKIVVDDDVQLTVTLHMRLPWDLALYHLAQKYSLRVVRAENEIRISHP
jgi:type II secretory pathway component GspD/PulD (secretin)